MSTPRRPTWIRSALAVLAALAIAAPGPAVAKKGKKKKKKAKAVHVQLTGVKSLDKVFKPLKKIDQKVTKAQKHRRKGKDAINSALGLKKGTSLPAAMAHLKKEAQGKVNVKVNGGSPTLEASDALPPHIKEGIEACNVLLKSYPKAIKELAGVPKQATKLVKEAKALPSSLKSEITSDPTNAIAIVRNLGVVKDNIKVASQLPKRAAKVTKGLNKDLKVMVSAFGGSWPPF